MFRRLRTAPEALPQTPLTVGVFRSLRRTAKGFALRTYKLFCKKAWQKTSKIRSRFIGKKLFLEKAKNLFLLVPSVFYKYLSAVDNAAKRIRLTGGYNYLLILHSVNQIISARTVKLRKHVIKKKHTSSAGKISAIFLSTALESSLCEGSTR